MTINTIYTFIQYRILCCSYSPHCTQSSTMGVESFAVVVVFVVVFVVFVAGVIGVLAVFAVVAVVVVGAFTSFVNNELLSIGANSSSSSLPQSSTLMLLNAAAVCDATIGDTATSAVLFKLH
jgi:hypothetical protein